MAFDFFSDKATLSLEGLVTITGDPFLNAVVVGKLLVSEYVMVGSFFHCVDEVIVTNRVVLTIALCNKVIV